MFGDASAVNLSMPLLEFLAFVQPTKEEAFRSEIAALLKTAVVSLLHGVSFIQRAVVPFFYCRLLNHLT